MVTNVTQNGSKMPSQNSADCPANCWIEFHVVDESGRAVNGITAVFIDSANKKYDVNFSGTPVILNNVKPGKGKMVFSSNNLYNESSYALRGPTSNPSKQNQVKYRKEPAIEKQISWCGPLMKDVTDPKKDGREIGDLVSKNSYEFILQLIFTEDVIIIGAQYDNNVGNKLKFAAQAVRALNHPRIAHYRPSVLMFTQRYTPAQIALVERAVLTSLGRTFRKITTLQEVFDYINERNGDDRWKYPIISLQFYSHDLPSKICFDYHPVVSGSQYLTLNNFTQLKAAAFSPSPATRVFSFACRTGLGPVGNSGNDDRTNSLAQKMANHLQIKVKAYIRRSDYTETWLNADESRLLNQYGSWRSLSEAFNDMRDWSEGDLGESGKKRLKELEEREDEWNDNKDSVDAMFLQSGAVHDVKVGTTDQAHTAAYMEFLPEKSK